MELLKNLSLGLGLGLCINLTINLAIKLINFYQLGKVNYPLYRINNKHILLGSIHINTFDTLKDIVINEFESSEQYYYENIHGIQNYYEIISNYYNKSLLEKFTHLHWKTKYPETNIGIFMSKLLYSSEIINETNKIGIKDIFNFHRYQLQFFGMDRVLEALSIKKNYNQPNNYNTFNHDKLDDIECNKYIEIQKKMVEIKYNKSIIIEFTNIFTFIPSYIFVLFGYEHNFNLSNIEFQLLLISCICEQYFIDKFNYTDYITNGRNNLWIEKIQENLSKDKKIFICVGSAHVFGLVKEFKKDFYVEKYNYWKNKFETI